MPVAVSPCGTRNYFQIARSRLKGSSSFFINNKLPGDNILYWQRGFGVITVSKENFQRIYDYVKNQEQHHKDGTILEEYETINVDDDEK